MKRKTTAKEAEEAKVSFTKPKLLLGEGVEEKMFFAAFIKALNLENEIQPVAYHGKSNLNDVLINQLNMVSGFENVTTIGITGDADDDYDTTEKRITGSISDAGFSGRITIKHFIMPGAGKPGALEALCIEAIRGTPAWSCVEVFEKCINAGGAKQLSATERDKRLLQAWLSAQETPNLRLGAAARDGIFPIDSPVFSEFKDFLRAL